MACHRCGSQHVVRRASWQCYNASYIRIALEEQMLQLAPSLSTQVSGEVEAHARCLEHRLKIREVPKQSASALPSVHRAADSLAAACVPSLIAIDETYLRRPEKNLGILAARLLPTKDVNFRARSGEICLKSTNFYVFLESQRKCLAYN